MIIENKKFLIYGLGKTGVSLTKFIIKNGGKVAVFDKKIKTLPSEIASLSLENRSDCKKAELFSQIDYMILSPGVSIYDDIVKCAISKKIKVVSEMDFSFENLCGVKIGITGSGGKSTTTKLIYEILKEEYEDVRICGNYGIPICDALENSTPKTISVIEVSSFMLEQSKNFHFDVAVFSNISKNHLDRHKKMKNYIKAKGKIIKNMTSSDVVIIPQENYKIESEIKRRKKLGSKAKTLYFKSTMTNQKPSKDCENKIENSILYVQNKQILSCDIFKIAGKHNLENLLTSCITAKHFAVSDTSIKKAVESFRPLPHRFEIVATKNGVRYINDSKATSGKLAETTLEMVDFPCVIMLGGSEKADEFYDLFAKIKNNPHVIKTVIYGKVAPKLQAHARGVCYHNFVKCENFTQAFNLAKSLCVSGSTLLLSPACPSFDEFANFEKRGERFKTLVEEISCDKKQ